jgi:hypothetical protein
LCLKVIDLAVRFIDLLSEHNITLKRVRLPHIISGVAAEHEGKDWLEATMTLQRKEGQPTRLVFFRFQLIIRLG